MSKKMKCGGKCNGGFLSGGAWFAAWLFTIGFLNLGFWQGLLAIIAWPYFLGVHFAI